MSSLKGDGPNFGLPAKETSSDISLGDQMELQQSYNYEQDKAASYLVSPNRADIVSTDHEPNLIRPSASYIVLRSDNLETNVDNWIQSCETERNRRRDNISLIQQPGPSEDHGVFASLWYVLALLPAISVQKQGWCTPSNSFTAMLNYVDLSLTYLKRVLTNVRTKLTRLAIDQVLHECFVIAMDFALALHAFIFLALAVYQSDQ